jgi:hypothetical protein
MQKMYDFQESLRFELKLMLVSTTLPEPLCLLSRWSHLVRPFTSLFVIKQVHAK